MTTFATAVAAPPGYYGDKAPDYAEALHHPVSTSAAAAQARGATRNMKDRAVEIRKKGGVERMERKTGREREREKMSGRKIKREMRERKREREIYKEIKWEI